MGGGLRYPDCRSRCFPAGVLLRLLLVGWSLFLAGAEGQSTTLRFRSDGTFKILQVSKWVRYVGVIRFFFFYRLGSRNETYTALANLMMKQKVKTGLKIGPSPYLVGVIESTFC